MIETIAASAIAILTPYLTEAGKGFASKAGEKLAQKAGEIYHLIKQKFESDKDAEQTLAQAEVRPESKPRQSALQEILLEKLQTDLDFATTLKTLVEEAQAADTRNVIAFQRGVGIGGNANGAIITTGDANLINKP